MKVQPFQDYLVVDIQSALNIAEIFTHPDMVLDIDKEVLITHIFNSTDKGMSMDKENMHFN